MEKMRRRPGVLRSIALVAALWGAAAGLARAQDAPTRALRTDASLRLESVVDEYWHWVRERGDALDISLKRFEEQARFATTVLERLDAIPPDELEYEERVTAQVLRWEARTHQDELAVYWHGHPYTPYGPLRGAGLELARRSFRSEEDLVRYLDRVERYGELFVAIREQAAGQKERGIVLPSQQLERALVFLDGFRRPPQTSPFSVPRDLLEAFSDECARSFQRAVSTAISEKIEPAVAALIEFVEGLRPHAPPGVGIGKMPSGREAYRRMVRMQSTLEVAPEEIHAIGLAAVDSLNEEMAKVRGALGFTGTKADFHAALRRDPQFFVETPEEFGERLMAHDARIRPVILKAFLREPAAPYGVARLDPRLEPELTYGYYNAPGPGQPKGLYRFNGSDLDQRSLLSAAALTFHELVPGHHFQSNLVLESETLSPFRKQVRFFGYSEGWGEYSSSIVARELGMYRDPYDHYGRLVFDMFFAVRLVVDTGMNALDWSLDQARAFMLEHTMESRVQVESETLRYTDWPAQALAYWLGRQEFVEARAEAERELGDRFDVRRFHDAVLSSGRLPLPVLRGHVREFIARERGEVATSSLQKP